MRAGEVLHGQRVEVTANGQPVANVPVQIKAQPQYPVQPAGTLYPSQGETAACTPGAIMSCITDADGVIEFDFVAPATQQTFDVLHGITATCTDPAKPCTPDPTPAQTVTVQGCPISLELDLEVNDLGLHQVEPDGELPGFVTAKNCDDDPAAGVAVEIKLNVDPASGFHPHGVPPPRPRGALLAAGCESFDEAAKLTCTTGPDGKVPFRFKAPEPSGSHEIEARCTDDTQNCNQAGPVGLDVKVDKLELIPASQFYTLTEANGTNIGDKPDGKHNGGINHNLTPVAIAVLEALAAAYSQAFDPPEALPAPLHINDASLPWGGLFDIYGNWATPHSEHRRGTVVDIRANLEHGAIPQYKFEQFEKRASKIKIDNKINVVDAKIHCSKGLVPPSCRLSDGTVDPIRHYHVRLLGQKE